MWRLGFGRWIQIKFFGKSNFVNNLSQNFNLSWFNRLSLNYNNVESGLNMPCLIFWSDLGEKAGLCLITRIRSLHHSNLSKNILTIKKKSINRLKSKIESKERLKGWLLASLVLWTSLLNLMTTCKKFERTKIKVQAIRDYKLNCPLPVKSDEESRCPNTVNLNWAVWFGWQL